MSTGRLTPAGDAARRRCTNQRVLEADGVLPLPLGLKHVSEVLGAGAQDAAVSLEGLSVDLELHVSVLTLLQ